MEQNKNWKLFYKNEDNKLVEFHELIWINKSLYHRFGSVKTYGESRKYTFNSQVELNSKVEDLSDLILKDKFSLEREWIFDPNKFDFKQLSIETIIATQLYLKNYINVDHKDINMFALISDDDCSSIGPICHKVKVLEKAEDEELFNISKWSIWEDRNYFDIPYRIILTKYRDNLSNLSYEKYVEEFNRAMLLSIKGVRDLLFTQKRAENMLFLYQQSMTIHNLNYFREFNNKELTYRYKMWLKSWY